MMTATTENLTLEVTQEIRVHAPIETTFASLLEITGPLFMSYPSVRIIDGMPLAPPLAMSRVA